MFDIADILKTIRKHFSRRDVLLILILTGLYFLTRLINIEKLPIFTDEGIYIQWAKVAWHDASWRFVSLTDGRQPLQTWATIPFLKLLPDNALLAGRLFAVATGLTALVGIFVLINYLFGKKAAFIGAFLYVFTPFFLFYDRLALMDSGINAAFIWILFFSIWLVKTLRLDVALLFGLAAGISLLAKSSTQLFLGLAAFSPILFLEKKRPDFIRKTVNYFVLYAVVAALAFVIYNIQRLSPFLHFVAEKNHTFILTVDEVLKNPFGSFQFNFYIIPYYILMESSFFLPVVGLIGWLLLLKNNRRLGIYLALWLFIPYIAISFFARVLYPRYIIFFASLFGIFLSYLLVELEKKRRNAIIISLILFFISIVYFDYTVLFHYQNIPLPPIDRGQYIEGGSSGGGIREIVDYARERAKVKPVIIVTEGNFGMAGDVLGVFVRRNDKIFIKAYWPLTINELQINQPELDKNTVLVVTAYQKSPPASWPVKLIRTYEKPGGQSAFNLYELKK